MNRNTELHFSNTPQINIKRSKFERSFNHKTTFNVGDIIPIMVDCDILPGDTVQLDHAEVVRMATPIYPIMDNLFLDTYFFFVPHRLVWDNWRKFWGENDDPWIQQTEYEIPQIQAPAGGWKEGTIADYMGLPTKVDRFSVSALPFRAYCKIWNDFFRDENLKQAAHIYTDETTRTGTNSGDYVLNAEKGALPLKAAKFHDYFTSALPAPQKGPAVTIPLGVAAPVSIASKTLSIPDIGVGTKSTANPANLYNGGSIQLTSSNTADPIPSGNVNIYSSDSKLSFQKTAISGTVTGNYGLMTNLYAKNGSMTVSGLSGTADLSNATAASINQLRTAFAIQKYYENAGLHGTRYIEYIRSVFGVTSSDGRFQRAEYLGGKRIPINIDQVLQTSATSDVSPQGNTAAFSCTIDKSHAFTKSFEEHGTLIGLAVVRTEHTYQQGIEKMWTRKKWTDFYNPFFAHLGEQAILNKEIYCTGTSAMDEAAFGYQEAWAEYRYKPSYVSGYMRSNAEGSLDVWHFADYYQGSTGEFPTLSSDWIDEPYTNVDRTIAVTSALSHQFIADFFFKTFYTRPMPIYSVPGLIDHV